MIVKVGVRVAASIRVGVTVCVRVGGGMRVTVGIGALKSELSCCPYTRNTMPPMIPPTRIMAKKAKIPAWDVDLEVWFDLAISVFPSHTDRLLLPG